jgi:flagellar basal-body rod protein FlgF
MIQGFYSAATALDAAIQNQDVVAQNLAHTTVPGYRRQGLAFETLNRALSQTSAPAPNLLGTRPSSSYTAFEPGPMQFTGNPLDLAINGESFFVVQGPNGPLYTRNGVFQLSLTGELQTKGGLPVVGTNGPITIPPKTAQLTVAPDGTVLADKVPKGRLQLAHFANPNVLVPAGTTLFAAPAEANPDTDTSKVEQGYREGSNVQAVQEMVSMIAGMRHYEAAQRALRSLSDAIQSRTGTQGG